MRKINKNILIVFASSSFIIQLISTGLVISMCLHDDYFYTLQKPLLVLTFIMMLSVMLILSIVLYGLILQKRYETYNEEQRISAIRDYYRYNELLNPSNIDT
jgi:hypothetical protein